MPTSRTPPPSGPAPADSAAPAAPLDVPAPPHRRSFPDALREAAALAAQSPSSHNSQPWGCARLADGPARRAAARLTGQADPAGREYVALALDDRHRLGALPAHAVEMRLSCGLFWQILLHGLAAQGWTLDGLHLADDADRAPGRGTVPHPLRAAGWPPEWSLLAVAGLRPGGEGAAPPPGGLDELRATVAARRTNRAPYRDEPVPHAQLHELVVPSCGAAADAPVTIRHLRSALERRRFADLVAQHGGRDFSHDTAWRETHSYLRRSEAEAQRRGDGFTLTQLFGPLSPVRHRLLRTALAPSTMRVLRHAGYHRFLARQLAGLVRPTPVLVAMGLDSDAPGPADMLRAGARLADYWLRATRLGLALHPVSVVLQHDDLREELEARLGLPGRTFFVSRLGYPTADFPAPPRRPVADRTL